MTRQPLVTVVIPTYNYGSFVEEAVRSAAAQSYPNIEIIVVDDGSTDDTSARLKRLQQEMPALQVLTTEHQGVSHARNHGTRAGRGLYVAYLDADDLWHPTKIEKQALALGKHANDPEWAAVYCLFRPISKDGKIFGSAPAVEMRGYFFARHLVINPIGNGSGMLIRRDAILEIGGFDPSLTHCEDLDIQLRLSKRYKIELVREYLVGYRQHRNSASTKHLEMADAVMEVASRHTIDSAVPDELRKAAFAAADRYLWYKYFQGGSALKGFQTLLRALMAEPAATFDNLMVRAAPSIRRRMSSLGNMISPRRLTTMPHFFEVEPTDGVTRHEPPAYARLSARLKKFDSLMYEHFVQPLNDEKTGE